jgi:hypothetical protein
MTVLAKLSPVRQRSPNDILRLESKGEPMIHVMKLIQRRFPNSSGRIISSLFALSASALAIGLGIMLLT